MSSKISALTSLASAQPDDVVPVVDVHDTTQASSGTTKKVTVGALGSLAARSVSANTTLASTDGLLIINAASGNLTVGLPNPATVTGRVFYLKRSDSTASYVTLTPFAAELIDGGAHGYVSNSGASISLVSDGTNWQLGPGYRQQPLPTAAKPYMNVPPAATVTQMQTGHGFTTTGADASSNLNDTSNFVTGTQAATLVTAGAGATTFLLHKGLAAVDMTARQYAVVIECDDPTHILTGTFQFLAGTGATSSTSYQWQLYTAGDIPQNVIQAGRWVYFVLNFADATVNGSPVRTAITDYYVKVNDDSTGNKVTVRVNAIYALPDSSGLAPYARNFPAGAATICFDDGFVSQVTNAKPVLDAAGLTASMFIIWDQIGLSNRLSQAQLLQFQDVSGWDINAHSLTDADHATSFANLTAAQLESNLANQQQIMASQGFQGQGTAYPKGEVTTTAIGLIRKYFQYSRGTYNKCLETLPVADMFNLRAISSISPVSGGSSPSAISAPGGTIDLTVSQHRWLILTFHKIIGNVTSCTNTTGTTYRIIYTDTVTPYNTGTSVTLQGFSPAGLNGTYTITANGTAGGFGYVEVAIPANPGTATIQGTALSATTDCDLASFSAIIAKLVSSGVTVLNMADMMKCLYPEPVGVALSSSVPLGDAAIASAGSASVAPKQDHQHPRTDWTPSDHGVLAWAYDPALSGSGQVLATAGTVYTIRMHNPVAQNITNILLALTVLGSGLTTGQCFAALYQSGTLLGTTADQTAIWNTGGSTGLKTAAISGGPVAAAAGDLIVAVWFNGTTGPSFAKAGTNSLVNAGLSAVNSRYGTANTSITTTAPGTLGTIAALSVAYWAALT